jgi:hypothetical protein
MVDQLKRVNGDSFVHSISEWNSEDSLRGTGYSSTLADSVFVPSPPANVHRECYRTYEALECNAIPVVDSDYYREAFGAPFPIVRPDWEDAPETLNGLLDNAAALEDLHEKCRAWWDAVRQDFPRKIKDARRRSADRAVSVDAVQRGWSGHDVPCAPDLDRRSPRDPLGVIFN